jgi:rhodanese-related sulfurtransferase
MLRSSCSSAEEFSTGHVDGVINIPLDSLAARAGAIPKNAVVITVESDTIRTELDASSRRFGVNRSRSAA